MDNIKNRSSIGETKMIKTKELDELVEILAKAGIEHNIADDIVIKAVGVAQDKKIPVIKALTEFYNPGGKENSVGYQLFIASRQISPTALNKLESLNTDPE